MGAEGVWVGRAIFERPRHPPLLHGFEETFSNLSLVLGAGKVVVALSPSSLEAALGEGNKFSGTLGEIENQKLGHRGRGFLSQRSR
jgi:hypothetical protein